MEDEVKDIIDNIEDLVVETDTTQEATETTPEEIPSINDLGWTKYVMSQFEDGETYDGWPRVDALRRVAQKLIGPILSSYPKTIQSPSPNNGFHACVEWHIEILDGDVIKKYGDVSDVCQANTDEPYCWHASPCAATKAEGRALRKVLNLQAVHAAEEMMDQPETTMGSNKFIKDSQFTFINMKCHDLNINAIALLNSGEKVYKNLREMPYEKGIKVFEYLNKIQIGTVKPKEELIGYDPDWMNKAGLNKGE